MQNIKNFTSANQFEVKPFYSITAHTYSDWKLGECGGVCGVGKRLDTRECSSGTCLEDSLERTVDCRLPTPCIGNQACESENLIYAENAKCIKFSTEASYQCECLSGYQGNGTYCGEGSSASDLNHFSNILMMVFATTFGCLNIF